MADLDCLCSEMMAVTFREIFLWTLCISIIFYSAEFLYSFLPCQFRVVKLGRQSENQGKHGIYYKSQGFQRYHRSQASQRQSEECPTFKTVLIFPRRYNYGDIIIFPWRYNYGDFSKILDFTILRF